MQDLKQILQSRINELNTSSLKEKNTINEESIKTLFKYLSLNNELLPLAQELLENSPRTKIVWLHLCECTGCSESVLRSGMPSYDELIFDFFSLEYHETLMIANGTKAEECLENVLNSNEEFILAVEGGVADGFFYTIGLHGESGRKILNRLAKKASIIFAVGSCASYGGIQAARPNPTRNCGIDEILTQNVVKIPGCPPSDVNIIATFFYYILFKQAPTLDSQNRPLWAYGKCLHDMCERKAKFESGIFAKEFGDEFAKQGACLFKLGCKGPYTYNNCPKIKFNSKTSWPVAAGRGCMACSQKDFWDDFGCYEAPMINKLAYKKITHSEKLLFENKNSNLNELDLNSDEIALYLKEKTQILYKENGENKEFLDFEFESNLKLVLQNLAKTKLGALLVENYKKEFSKNYDFIQENFDETPALSSDIWTFFESNFILAKGEFLYRKSFFIDCAKNYSFTHASPYDFKLNINEKAKLDINKAFRCPLIYLCGGLELSGLAFSAIKAFAKSVNDISKHFNDKKLVLCLDDDINSSFLHSLFSPLNLSKDSF
ncbi:MULTISPECIES: hydrogenase small subunit [unclassified Campylobacter]|uniref:hydrogenase small subunit n=1 Tax=unclassified Campylobacter TaxID=2593542 RepID=UPI001237D892|nr:MULTISPECIES: hydrogenase small subunit [unclassified Campylobacter]KAA6225146.1 hydrogenase small subunit [Campylobacter sp. LR196d]KAA6226160.1 hydrogenase small subunit [Campylobacter sp. LR185c]KAA6228108.1 hydrogenase small subunit [Campylobacter sp. LR286c]KAA6231360.1 hydrogenase small subunit [Campylobacter sp. LR264d]KAA6231572.1 hydrogenase small subunit [Campylobacter sp. LR291e]